MEYTYLVKIVVGLKVKNGHSGSATVPSMEEVKFKLAQILHSLQFEPSKVLDKKITYCRVPSFMTAHPNCYSAAINWKSEPGVFLHF